MLVTNLHNNIRMKIFTIDNDVIGHNAILAQVLIVTDIDRYTDLITKTVYDYGATNERLTETLHKFRIVSMII